MNDEKHIRNRSTWKNFSLFTSWYLFQKLFFNRHICFRLRKKKRLILRSEAELKARRLIICSTEKQKVKVKEIWMRSATWKIGRKRNDPKNHRDILQNERYDKAEILKKSKEEEICKDDYHYWKTKASLRFTWTSNDNLSCIQRRKKKDGAWWTGHSRDNISVGGSLKSLRFQQLWRSKKKKKLSSIKGDDHHREDLDVISAEEKSNEAIRSQGRINKINHF